MAKFIVEQYSMDQTTPRKTLGTDGEGGWRCGRPAHATRWRVPDGVVPQTGEEGACRAANGTRLEVRSLPSHGCQGGGG